MKEVIVTGGRGYDRSDNLFRILDLFNISLIIQGGATGADNLAKKYAFSKNVPLAQVDADWEKYGRAAGPIRNREMLEQYPNAIVIAFPGERGTENCIKQALELGRLVLQVRE